MRLFGNTDTKENPVLLTPWTLIHFTSGGAANEYVGFWPGQALSVVYEVIDPKIVWGIWADEVGKKSIGNSVADHAFFTLGQFMLKGSNWKWVTVALFAGLTTLKVEL